MTTTSSWARRCGAHGPNGPITATCWRGPNRSRARPASRLSSSTCGVPGSTSARSGEMTGTTDFNEVFFDEVRVPAANVIGTPGQGLEGRRRQPGRGAFRCRWRRGGRRSDAPADRRGPPAAARWPARPSTTGRFASSSATLPPASRIQRHLGQRIATKAARGQITPADAPLSKIWFSEFNLEMTEAALALQGARSMAGEGDELSDDDGRWQDAFLYARAWTIAGGSNEIMRNIIAERGLGLPREPRGQ